MTKEWNALTKLTEGKNIIIERIKLVDENISIEGSFELPPITRLSQEDQVFIAAFIRSHGSIKHMEQLFGVSYPTVKSRLNRIGAQLDFVAVDMPGEKEDTLERLSRGEISVNEAISELESIRKNKGE